jgi:PAS domain S-box-containing protein
MVLSNLNGGEISFRRLAENLPGIIYRVLIEDNNRMIFFNDMVQTMTGYGPEDLKRGEVCSIDPLIFPEDKINVINTIKNAIKDEIPFEVEYRIKHKNGNVKWFIDRGKPIKGDNGKPSYIDGVIFDITKRKRMELKLLESKNRYQFISENVNDMISILDEKMRYEFVNEQAFFNIMGRKKEMWCRNVFKMGFETGKGKVEARFKDENGDYHWFEIKGKLFIDFEGKTKGLTISRDITKYKLLENDLENTIKKLDILNRIILSGNKAEDLTILLKTVLDSTLKLMDFEGGGIYLVDETNRTAEIVYHKDVPLDFFEQTKKVKIDENIYRKVFIEGVPIYTNNYPQINPERAKKWNILSLASIPLFTKDRIIGSLNIASKSRYTFSADEKSLLQSIGAEMGIIIEKMFVEQSLRESELNFKTLFNSLSDFLFVFNTEGGVLRVNRSVIEQLKYSEQEIMNMNIFNFYPSYLHNEVSAIFGQIIEGKTDYCDIPLLTKDGKLILVETKFTRGEWDNKDVFFGISRDVTEKKEAEKNLRKIAHRWRTTFDAMSESVFLIDIEKNILQCNKATLDILGKEKYKEIIGHPCCEIMHGTNEPIEWCPMVRMIESHHKESSIAQIGDRWCEISVDPVINDEGTLIGAVHIITDITERRKVERELKESEEKYRYLIENSLEGVWVIDSNANAILINPSMAKMLGYTAEEMVGKSLFTFMDKKEIKNTKKHLERRKKGISEERDSELIHKNGKKIYLKVRASPIFDIEGKYEGTFAFLSNITQRKLTEEKLKDSEEKYRYLFDNAQVGLYWSSISDGKILECNDTFTKLLGYDTREECLENFNVIEHYIDPNARSEILEEIHDNEEDKNYEIHVTKKDGTPIWVSVSARMFEKEDRIEGAFIDITERKKAERELQLERDNLLNIFNSMEDGVYIVDKNYNLEYVNPSLVKEFGQFEGMKCFKYFEDLNEICPQCKNKELFQGKTLKGEWFSFKNQKTYDLIDTPLKNPDGSISKLGIFRDETDRKQAEKIIKESEEKYRVLFESSPISLWEEDFSELKNYIELLKNSGTKDFRVYFDKNPEEVKKCVSMIKIVDINKKTIELYKANKKDDFFVGLDNVFTEEYIDTFKEIIISLVGGKTRFESETINCTFNGDKLFVFLVCEIVAGFKEDWSKALISIIDISERKKAEQKLIGSEEKFRTIAERTLMGIIIVQDNQFKYVNDALLNMFEYSKEEVLNWKKDDLTKLIHPDELLFLREYHEHLRSSDKRFKPFYSYRVFTKSGKVKWIDQFSKEIYYKGRSAELVTIIDITEKKEAEQELIKLNDLKSELLRRTSHELRTPLVSIKGFSDLLLELHSDKLDDYVINSIKQIKEGCSRLESLVNDILKTAELKSGTTHLKKSKEDLSLLIKICVSELEGLSELRNHKIILNIPDELFCKFEKGQMHKVICNILNNGIKFTPINGRIEIKTEKKNSSIIISIKDNGLGFTKEEKSLIFKQFGKIERYGQGYDVISEGSGLGLYISKKIVELHGGQIWVESEGKNKGSTFNITLPLD